MTELKRRIALVMLAAAASTSACGDSNPADPVVNAVNENSLVFTRADQTQIQFGTATQLSAWCGAWEPGLIATPAVHVRFTGSAGVAKRWILTAVVADVRIGTPLTFPNDFIFDRPRNADLFINDSPNELSTTRSLSSGSITFQQLDCYSGGRVEFTIAATVASEFAGGQSVSVSGRLNAPIGQAPQ